MKDFWSFLKIKSSILKDIGFVGFSNFFGLGSSALLWFFLAKELGAGSYGEIQYYLSIAGIAYIISSLGTPNVITVYAAKKIEIFSTLMIISLAGGFIAFTALVILFQRIDLGLLVIAFIIHDFTLNYFLGKKSYKDYSKYFILQKCLMIIMVIGLYYLIGFNGILYGIIISHLVIIFITIKLFKISKINFSNLKLRMEFVSTNYFERLVSGLKGEMDKLIIIPFLGFEILGNYALGIQFYSILMILSQIFLKYQVPQDASNISNKKLKKLILINSIGMSIIGIVVFPKIIEIFFADYTETIITIQIMSLAATPATLGFIYISEFLGLEKARYVVTGRILSLLTLITGIIILSNYYGIVGAASSFVLASCAQTIFYVFAKIRLEKQKSI